ncbi:hypothetical protein DACRYDRAFT_103996 [Dacryopinax primogenitus]|uniref:Uncharacterized protein n=1 Tax=Dacryopinax primogenitus (strain DJM 731) TaxID=1858805 RepID=M5GEL2_DACPD|nr:uncharacterized protein DACRYDRAFT_103996 [Dacryopinax primogenitus]EJU05512.1 hypothetical protein DACRYDRAFT_103996 [Dacryopinax primogenitus]
MAGLTKTLWYHMWVKGGKHKKTLLPEGTALGMPIWYAWLPKQVGYPAGGSLTSNEWKCLLILYGPATIPYVLWKGGHHEAAWNYLKLAAAMKIFMRQEVTEDDLEQASELYQQFYQEYAQIYGTDNITPTFHWVTHMAAQVQCFGPVRNFQMFLYEHLNKVLKSVPSNRHKQGILEVSFAYSFKHKMSLTHLHTLLATQHEDPLAWLLTVKLQHSTTWGLVQSGTLAVLVAEAQDQAQAWLSHPLPGGNSKNMNLLHDIQECLLDWYRCHQPNVPIHHPGDPTAPWHTNFLNHKAVSYSELCFEGKCIMVTLEKKSFKGDSLVLLKFQPGTQWVGKVHGLF